MFRRSLSEFDGSPKFYVSFRLETYADRSGIPWGGGADIAAGSFGPTNYSFSIARDQAKLNRDNRLPIVFADIAPGVPHTHRLELHGAALYSWYIDDQLVEQGVPEGPFPSFTPRITWRAKAAWLPNTTRWDYIRYGVIPQDGTGDFDSNGVVDANDTYFFLDCLLTQDGSYPGCKWADMNADGTVNGADITQFAEVLVNQK